MKGKSNSFLPVSPFIPRSGILSASYIAFPLDIIDRQNSPFGCLSVLPLDDFASSGDAGGPFTPLTKAYQLFNIGGADLEWAASSSETWASLDVSSGTIAKGDSVVVTITLDPDELGDFTFNQTSLISFLNNTNGCGSTDISVIVSINSEFPVQTIMFNQYDGDFVYPSWLPQNGFRYYLNESMSGDMKFRFAPVAGNVGSRQCETGPDDTYASGTQLTTYSGGVTFNLLNSSVVGSIGVSLFQDGVVSAYDHNAGTTQNFTYNRIGDVLNNIGPAAQSYGVISTDESLIQRWSTTQHETGWFPGSVGGRFDSIYCETHTVNATSFNPVTVEDLGIPIARSGGVGSAAQTQTTGTFDTTTRVNHGNFSRGVISVAVNPARENLTGTFVFTVTPTVGDPYQITVIKDFPISGMSTVNGTVDFPQVPEAVIHMDSWTYSYQKALAESFESYDVAIQIVTLGASPSWPNPIVYGAPAPNTNCWDDFDAYPEDVNQDGIYLNITGERWAGPGSYSAVNYTEFFDDFEGYAIGTTNLFGQGAGWTGAGSSAIVAYGFCYDDFESYPIGTIFLFDFTSTDNLWNGDGHSA